MSSVISDMSTTQIVIWTLGSGLHVYQIATDVQIELHDSLPDNSTGPCMVFIGSVTCR